MVSANCEGGALLRTTHAVLFCSALACGLVCPVRAQVIDTLALRAHTRFLADDALLGRNAGSPGEAMAARYIESQATRLGLTALPGASGFAIPVPLMGVSVEQAELIVTAGAESVALAHGSEFLINAGGSGAFSGFDGPAVLIPERMPTDSPDSTDLAGRVLILTGGLGVDAGRRVRDWASRGALAVVQLSDFADQLALISASRGPERLFVVEDVDDPVWQPAIPIIIAGPRAGRPILAAARSLVSGSGADGPAVIELPVDVALRVNAQPRPVAAANVAAVLPGSDPARDDYIVFTAHYDHLGVGLPAADDSIYNGFSDNAAGVAMLLAIAEALRTNPPPCSVVFLFTTAEERGLLGSSYFAASGVLPLDRITAVINLDAGAPPAPPVSWRVAGDPDAPLSRTAASVAARYAWRAETGPASANSDHWPFLARGVPAIFIVPGESWEGLDAAGRDALRQRWDRYHHPDDEWHSDFPFAGLERYAEFAMRVALAAAQR